MTLRTMTVSSKVDTHQTRLPRVVVSGLGALRGLDALWVNYSPITVAWPMWTARYGLKIRQVAHVLDLWPDTLLARGLLRRGHTYRLAEVGLNARCNGMYRASESVAYI